MRVTVDPMELMTMAVTMGTSAVELADVGTSIRSCVGCAMPPEVRNMVDEIVARADSVLDMSAAVFRAEAADVARRALIATHDSLAAASLAAAPPAMTAAGGGNLGGFVHADGAPATWERPPIQPPQTTSMGGWAEFQARNTFPPSPPNNDWTEFNARSAGLPRADATPGLASESRNANNAMLTAQLMNQMDGFDDPSPIYGPVGETRVTLNSRGEYVMGQDTFYD